MPKPASSRPAVTCWPHPSAFAISNGSRGYLPCAIRARARCLWRKRQNCRNRLAPNRTKPGTKEQRRKWLLAQSRAAPSDREQLLYEFLPSIFGYGDPEALILALDYLYSKDISLGSATAGYLRSYYSASELIPVLRRAQQTRGKNHSLEQLLDDIAGTGIAHK